MCVILLYPKMYGCVLYLQVKVKTNFFGKVGFWTLAVAGLVQDPSDRVWDRRQSYFFSSEMFVFSFFRNNNI